MQWRRLGRLRQDAGDQSAEALSPTASTPLRVVVVDDSPMALALYRPALTRVLHPATVSGFHCGVDALKALRAEHADLLLSDYQMPGMDGLELISAVAHDGLARRRVLFSSDSDPWLPARAHEVGAHAFLSKGDLDGLLMRLQGLMAPLRVA